MYIEKDNKWNRMYLNKCNIKSMVKKIYPLLFTT